MKAVTASMAAAARRLPVVLRCASAAARRVRYVLDSLFMAADIPLVYVEVPPTSGPWLLHAGQPEAGPAGSRALFLPHDAQAWEHFAGSSEVRVATKAGDLQLVLGGAMEVGATNAAVGCDLVVNAFYFLSSWAERRDSGTSSSRQLHATSEFVRLGVPQDIVDRYLSHLLDALRAHCACIGAPPWPAPEWPGGHSFAMVLSHDVDFLPVGPLDNLTQGAKTVLRHLLRHRDPGDAWRAARGWLSAVARGRDPYGCVPQIIQREEALGVRSSFQVAVGHRHPNDVNYHIESDSVRDYLRAITDAGFDLCLHGSYRSTENPQWYVEEVELLARRLSRPQGSRQHFLSFDYDTLFAAQEQAGIQYDMSMGYPDSPGPRAGFSYPYFPYNLREDRPYRVLQISLFLMDVTLRGYLGLRPAAAKTVIDACLHELRDKRGCASAVWHPIVFGGARDPGYDSLYYEMTRQISTMGGLGTDGHTVNTHWRERAARYSSFS